MLTFYSWKEVSKMEVLVHFPQRLSSTVISIHSFHLRVVIAFHYFIKVLLLLGFKRIQKVLVFTSLSCFRGHGIGIEAHCWDILLRRFYSLQFCSSNNVSRSGKFQSYSVIYLHHNLRFDKSLISFYSIFINRLGYFLRCCYKIVL